MCLYMSKIKIKKETLELIGNVPEEIILNKIKKIKELYQETVFLAKECKQKTEEFCSILISVCETRIDFVDENKISLCEKCEFAEICDLCSDILEDFEMNKFPIKEK